MNTFYSKGYEDALKKVGAFQWAKRLFRRGAAAAKKAPAVAAAAAAPASTKITAANSMFNTIPEVAEGAAGAAKGGLLSTAKKWALPAAAVGVGGYALTHNSTPTARQPQAPQQYYSQY